MRRILSLLVCSLPAAGVIAEAMVALVLADALLDQVPAARPARHPGAGFGPGNDRLQALACQNAGVADTNT